MTLGFYNGNNRFVLVDFEVHGCADVVRQMQWRRPEAAWHCSVDLLLSRNNLIALTYLALLCFLLVAAPVARATVAPVDGGNVTIETTEMFTVTYSTYSFLGSGPPTTAGIVRDPAAEELDACIAASANISSVNDTSKICELPHKCPLPPLGGVFCKWRTDFLDFCRSGASGDCASCVEEFVELDEKSTKYFEQYNHVLTRFDCRNESLYKYSMWTCDECRHAYKDWLCSTQIPYYENDILIEPCGQFCERTEARCPYFLPQKPYCGQRTFFCSAPRETARSLWHLNKETTASTQCFTCNFTMEDERNATSVEDFPCSPYLVNISEVARSAGRSVHNSRALYSVMLALALCGLLAWTLTPTVVAGT